jgi:hypothetical protein
VLVLQVKGDRLQALASPGLRGRLAALDRKVEIEYGM